MWHSRSSWPSTVLSDTPGGSELTNDKASLSANLVIPLAVGENFHTVLCPTIVVGLPWSPVRIDQGLSCWVHELSLRVHICHAQESSFVVDCDQLLYGSVLGSRTWGGQLPSSLPAHLLGIFKRLFRVHCLEDLVSNTLAIREDCG